MTDNPHDKTFIYVAAGIAGILVFVLIVAVIGFVFFMKCRKIDHEKEGEAKKKEKTAKKQWDLWVEEGEHVRLKGMKRSSDDDAEQDPSLSPSEKKHLKEKDKTKGKGKGKTKDKTAASIHKSHSGQVGSSSSRMRAGDSFYVREVPDDNNNRDE